MSWPHDASTRLVVTSSGLPAEDGMSDLYIRVIPTDPQWQPTLEAASRAADYIAGLFTGPGDHVESVEPVFYERVTLIDGGQYMADIFCSRCDASIWQWFWDLLIARNGRRPGWIRAVRDKRQELDPA